MTKEQLKKGNSIELEIKTAKDRLEAFHNLCNSGECEDGDNFSIRYKHGNVQCVIQETGDIYDILKALIRYESDKIERLKKEFEEL